MAGAYYWHRFFSHQPDLNFDNDEVRSAMLRTVDRWLDLGVDGVRLDAVPYLFERDGTNCENLPETHAFLQGAAGPRRHATTRAGCCWPRPTSGPRTASPTSATATSATPPSTSRSCPGCSCRCAWRTASRSIDILQQTPELPEGCQWAIFLRNHDELTLEMVTDEERDYMYRAYAADPQMRVNVGIRRRLAPLMQNDRRKIELMNGLLFALPGTPVIYYGDELGMGDNVYLGDRDAVRTPMQWSPDRNAGFSTVNPQRLFLPVIIDPEYHFETVNVEAQQQNPSSLLWWMRRIIALRSQHRVFGRGSIEFLLPENAKVLAFTRHFEGETVLVVANLSRFAQTVMLDLHEHRGSVPVELFGGSEFAPIVEGGYNLTLGPYGFYWFALQPQHHDALGTAPEPESLPVIAASDDWRQLFPSRGRGRSPLARAWPAFFERNRWYAGRTRTVRTTEMLDAVPVVVGRGKPAAFVTLVQVEYTDGEPETYIVPITAAAGNQADRVLADHPHAAIAWVDVRGVGRAGAAVRRHRRRLVHGGGARRVQPQPHLRLAGWGRAAHLDLGRPAPRHLRVDRPVGVARLVRPEQHLGDLRQPGGHEDLPPGPGRREPRSRDRPVPVRRRLRAQRAVARCARVPAWAHRAAHARRAQRATCPTRATSGTTRSTRSGCSTNRRSGSCPTTSSRSHGGTRCPT